MPLNPLEIQNSPKNANPTYIFSLSLVYRQP